MWNQSIELGEFTYDKIIDKFKENTYFEKIKLPSFNVEIELTDFFKKYGFNSIKVPEGLIAEIYFEDNFKGFSQ